MRKVITIWGIKNMICGLKYLSEDLVNLMLNYSRCERTMFDFQKHGYSVCINDSGNIISQFPQCDFYNVAVTNGLFFYFVLFF